LRRAALLIPVFLLALFAAVLFASGSGAAPKRTLTVTIAGTGTGTVTSSPAGISCPGDCTEQYNNNTVVAVTPVANAGSVFTGWTGQGTGSPVRTFNMNANKSATATFNLASSGEPAPIVGQGYTRVFADEFDSFDSSVWTDHVWYLPPPPAGAITVSGGILHLVSRRPDGYPEIGITTRRDTQASTRSWRQGYFEARMKLTPGKAVFPAFWLFGTAHSFGIDCPPYTSELDIFEGQGSEPTVYYGTLHRNTASPCGLADQTRGGYHNIGLNLYDGAFHLFSAKWTATQVCWYFDEALIECVAPFDSTDQDMFVLFESKAGGWTGPPDATTPDEIDTQVDYFRVWQQ
jgi:beta-glucanase (GH16 family)